MGVKTQDANTGPKIPLTTRGSKITFNDDLQLDLAKRERDYEVKIDVCEDRDGNLTTGIGERYVAQIIIPPKQYNDVLDGTDSEGNPRIVKEPVPFSMTNVEVTLFAYSQNVVLVEPEGEVQ